MKAILGCNLAVALLLVACSDSQPPEMEDQVQPQRVETDDVIAKNTIALGGEAALNAVQTMVKRSLIEEGDYRNIAVFATDRRGRMRVDIFAGGERVFAESYDGLRGHQWRPKDGQTEASERGTVALSHTPQLPNHIFRLKDLVANGHHIALFGTEVIDDVEYYVMRLTLSDGFKNFLYVEAESGLVTRIRNKRALHVDVDDDEKVIETLVSDFRRVGNIVHPHSVIERDTSSGEILVRITLQSMAINDSILDEYFTDLVNQIPTEK